MEKSIYLVLCLIFVLYFNTNAQFFDDSFYSKGFIVTDNNDTINGYIESKDGYLGKIKYTLNENDKKKQKVDTKTVKYMKVGFDTFEKLNYEERSYLMKIIVKGEISFYKNTEQRSTMSPGGMGAAPTMSYSESEVYYLVKNDKIIKIKKRKLQDLLKELMIDCQELYTEIDKLDTDYDMLDFNLKNLIVKYNYKIKNKTAPNTRS